MIRGLVPLAAMVAAMCALLALGPKLFSQMASGNAKDAPVRPLPPGMKAPEVDFRDVAAQAGLTAEVIFGVIDQTYIVENTGTGVAIFDYDNDGLPDIFLLQGDRLHNLGPPLTPHLYHNKGGLHFEDVTAKAGIGHLGWSQECAPATRIMTDTWISSSANGGTTCSCTTWETARFVTRRSNAAWTGRNHDGAQGAPLSITIATAISTWWCPIMLTLKPRKPRRRATRADATGRECPSPAARVASKARR